MGYGFALFNILEISEINDDLIVKFARLPSFSVMLRLHRDYIFGFAATEKDIEKLITGSFKIQETSLTSLQACMTSFFAVSNEVVTQKGPAKVPCISKATNCRALSNIIT